MSEKAKQPTKAKQLFGHLLGNPIAPIRRDFVASKAHLQETKAALRSRLDHLHKDREAKHQDALEADFQRVLDAWGIRERDIPRVINTLYIRLAVMFAPALLACIVFLQPLSRAAMLIAGAPLLLASLVGVLTTLWRISILRNRQFYPFHRALTRFISKKLA
jgi:hypothetical protein